MLHFYPGLQKGTVGTADTGKISKDEIIIMLFQKVPYLKGKWLYGTGKEKYFAAHFFIGNSIFDLSLGVA